MDAQPVIDKILETFPETVAIYRFGSVGTVYEREDSDLDLAFLMPRLPVESVRRFQLEQDLTAIVKRPVDLIDLRAASTVLRFQVISTGVTLFCANDYESELFATLVYSQYDLLNLEQRELIADIKKRGGIY